jgi:succinate dehydrogenase/fumarate reductase flavoprotein subunit
MIANNRHQPVDLLVLGAGMAGLAAAAHAAREGASVVLVEKAPRVGESAEYAGFLWTAPTLEVMREINPDGDPSLAARLVEGYPDAMDWVRSLGVEVKEPVTVLGYGRGSQTDMPHLLSTANASSATPMAARSCSAPIPNACSWRTDASTARRL